MNVKTQISIIIPTLHRKESLIRLIDRLLPQMSSEVEVIIVEQGDNNGQEFLRYAKKHEVRVKYIFTDQHNTARAKNVGALKAMGMYFIFFDDDVLPHKDVIKNLLKNFSDATIGCVAGRAITPSQKLDLQNRNVGRISPWGTFSDGYSSTIRQYIDTPVGCNMAFSRTAFEKVGGFDERYTAAIREESDLALRLIKAGYRVVFDPTAVVTHLQEPTGGGRKTEGRMSWYFNFLSNETYFFLKHCNHIYFPIFLITRMNWILRCMFGFGREVSWRSMSTPYKGISDGFRKYKELNA